MLKYKAFDYSCLKDNKSLKNFNISSCQMRPAQEFKNSVWYNTLGEYIGWGDLDLKDLVDIKRNLKDSNEIFLILRESTCTLNFECNCQKIHLQNVSIDFPSLRYISTYIDGYIDSEKIIVATGIHSDKTSPDYFEIYKKFDGEDIHTASKQFCRKLIFEKVKTFLDSEINNI